MNFFCSKVINLCYISNFFYYIKLRDLEIANLNVDKVLERKEREIFWREIELCCVHRENFNFYVKSRRHKNTHRRDVIHKFLSSIIDTKMRLE